MSGLPIPAEHPTAHMPHPHNSEFCNKCCHEAYCDFCRAAFASRAIELALDRITTLVRS